MARSLREASRSPDGSSDSCRETTARADEPPKATLRPLLPRRQLLQPTTQPSLMRSSTLALALVAAAACAVRAAELPPGVVSRWVASEATDAFGQPVGDGDSIAGVPDEVGDDPLDGPASAPKARLSARGCHTSMSYESSRYLSTRDADGDLDPDGEEWLVYIVGKQTGTAQGYAVYRYGYPWRFAMLRGLAYTLSTVLIDRYTTPTVKAATKMPDTLNMWSVWATHIKRVGTSEVWQAVVMDNNDDSAATGGGISGYNSDTFTGNITMSGSTFYLGGSFSSFQGEILEAGVLRRKDIDRDALQAFLDERYHLACPELAPAGSAAAQRAVTPALSNKDADCSVAGSPAARDLGSCTQTCAAGASRVAGTAAHICNTGAWSGSPIVCEGVCPQVAAPASSSVCYQVALGLDFGATQAGGKSGTAGLAEGPLRQLTASPAVPSTLLGQLWSIDGTSGVVRSNASGSCDPAATPSALVHSNPLWASFVSASSAVAVDVTLGFTASSTGTGSLGVVTRYRDVDNYLRLTVSLNYPDNDPGTDPATALNAMATLESVRAGAVSSLASGVIAADDFDGTQALRLRLWVKQASLVVYAGPQTWPAADQADAPRAYGFGPPAGGGSGFGSEIVNPVNMEGAGSVPMAGMSPSGFAGWSTFSASVTNLDHGEDTAGLYSDGAGWFDDLVVSTDCQAGRACQYGSSTMQCVHGCAVGYQAANGTQQRTCNAGTTSGSVGAWSGEELRCAPVKPAVPPGLEPFDVPENSLVDTPVGTPLSEVVKSNASDVAILFSLQGTGHMRNGQAVFKIAGCSGQVYVDNGGSANLNHETDPRFDITVAATPNGEVASATTFVVTIMVTDVDEAPVLVSPANRSVNEAASPGSDIGLPLEWSDPDCPDIATCDSTPAFTIVGGSPASWQTGGASGQPVFALGNTTGQLVVGAGGGLDFETLSEYTLTVRAASPADNSLFSTATVVIYVLDGPDPPFAPMNQPPISVEAPDVSPGKAIGGPGSGSFVCGNASAQAAAAGSFFACDSDVGTTLTYTKQSVFDIVSGSFVASDVIRIHSTTGAITWGPDAPANVGSREVARVNGVSVYYAATLTVSVSDGGLATVGSINILVGANATGRPTLDSLRILTSSGYATTSAPTTGSGYKLDFTGAGLSGPGVFGVASGSCHFTDEAFSRAQPVPIDVSSCDVMSATSVQCLVPRGAGQKLSCNLQFTVSAVSGGGTRVVDAITSSELLFSYRSPSIPFSFTSEQWPTEGGGTHVLNGTGFGWDPAIVKVDVGDYGYSNTPESDMYQFPAKVLSVQDNGIVIERPEMYGLRAHFRVNVGGGTYQSFFPFVNIEAPEILKIEPSYSGIDMQELDTYSRTYIILTGKNFGPYNSVAGATLRPSGCLYRNYVNYQFTCPDQSTTSKLFGDPYPDYACYKSSSRDAHTVVRCSVPRWAGRRLGVHVCIPTPSGTGKICSKSSVYTVPGGLPGVATALNTVGYVAPEIASLIAPSVASTEGGDLVTIRARNVGPIDFDGLTVRYGPKGYESRWIYAQNCKVTQGSYYTSPGTVVCNMAPMPNAQLLPLANNHQWLVTVSGDSKGEPGCCSSYGPPILSAISGPGAADAVTPGGQAVVISGKNFGPSPGPIRVMYYLTIDKSADDSAGGGGGILNATDIRTIGDGSGEFYIQPNGGSAACKITVDHLEITCETAPAGGSGLRWEVFAYNRSSVPPLTAYAPPRITSIELPDGSPVSGANPLGGTAIVIRGENFGPPQAPYGPSFVQGVRTGPLLEWARYGSPGRWKALSNLTITNHTQINAILGPGIGSSQTVIVSVAGQESGANDAGATFSFSPPVLATMTPLSGPTVPSNVISGDAADSFKVRGTIRNVPEGYRVQALFGNPSDSSRVDPPISASVTFDDTSPDRTASFQFDLPAGASSRRYVSLQVTDPNSPTSAPTPALGVCAFSYRDPVLKTFQVRRVPASETLPNQVLFNFPNRALDAYAVTLVGEYLTDATLEAAAGARITRVVEVNIGGQWYTDSTTEGMKALFVSDWTDSAITTYMNFPPPASGSGPPVPIDVRVRITGSADSTGPSSGCNPAISLPALPENTMTTQQTAPITVTLARPGVSGIVGAPAGGFATAGAQFAQVQVQGTELVKAAELSVVVADLDGGDQLDCAVGAVIAKPGDWNAGAYSPATVATWSAAQVVNQLKEQCKTYYNLSSANDVPSLPASQPCSLFCVTPPGQGSSKVLAFVTDTDPTFGSSVGFPYQAPALATAAAGQSVGGAAPVFGTAYAVSATAPGGAAAGMLELPADGTGYLHITGTNFGIAPQVWFFRDSPDLDDVDSFVAHMATSTDPLESFSHTDIVVRVPKGWGTARRVWVRTPPGELQVGADSVYFDYRKPVVGGGCVWDADAGECATGAAALAQEGATLRVQVSDLGSPLELSSPAAAPQFVPISVVIRDGTPSTTTLSGITAAGFCGTPPADRDGHMPVRCVIQGNAPSQDEFGNACPGSADPLASPAQRVPASLPSLSSSALFCTLQAGAGQNLFVQVAVGPRTSEVVLDRRRALANGAPANANANGARALAGAPVSFMPPVIKSGFSMRYDASTFADDLQTIQAAIAAQQAARVPGTTPPPLALNSSFVTSSWPAGNLTGPTSGGFIVVIEGAGFGRDYATASGMTLAAASRVRAPVPTAPFTGTPPAVPLKRSCLFASAPWKLGRTPGNSPVSPSCDGAESYQGEGEAADATYLGAGATGWRSAMVPADADDVFAPVVLAWTDTAIAFRVPPGAGQLALQVSARGLLSTATPFQYLEPVISSVSVMAPVRAVPAGVDPNSLTDLAALNLDPSLFASDDPSAYVALPGVPISGAVSTDGEQVIVIRGANFGPAPPLPSAYASMPPANGSLAVPRPIGNRFPAAVVSVRGSASCATGYYQWDVRGTSARVTHVAPPAARPYESVLCSTRVLMPLAAVPGRLVPELDEVERMAVLFHSHDTIVMRAPPGVGHGRSLRVVVHSYETPESGPPSDPVASSVPYQFDYAPPTARRLADSDLRITDGPTSSSPIMVLGSSLGRVEDQPANPAALPASSVAYRVALRRRYDGGWNTGGVVRDQLAGVLDLKLDGRPCLDPPTRLDVKGSEVMAAAQNEAGIVSAVKCASANVSDMTVGRHVVDLGVAGVTTRLENASAVYVGCAIDYYGLEGTTCRKCPTGARCSGMVTRFNHSLPAAEPGYYDLGANRFNLVEPGTTKAVDPLTWLNDVCPSAQPREDVNRGICVVPCFPPDACLGNNLCSVAYSSLPQTFTGGPSEPRPSDFKFRCAYCAQGYYRRTSDCERCPDQPILLILAFIVAVVLVAALGLYLSSRNINVALINTGVDTFQVLSLFTTARISWPDEVRTIFELMSTFSLNIEITAPECLIPSLSYETKWWMVMLVPILTQVGLLLVFLGYALFKRFVKGQRGRRKFCSHAPKLVSAFMVALYFYYVLVSRKVMDVFDCEPVPNAGDDALYMAAGTLDKCGEPGGLQARLQPFAVFFLLFYTLGLPLVLLVIMYRKRFVIMTDQLLRAKGMGFKRATNSDEGYQLRKMIGRVYFAYRPGVSWIWVQAILMRKLAICITSVLLPNDSSFILTSITLVLIVSYAIHVRFLPFMSPGDRPRILRDHARQVMEGDLIAQRMQKAIEAVEGRQRKSTRRVDWSDPSRAAGSMSAARRNALALGASVLVDYNVVEGMMLFVTILVSLSGILFNTSRFEGDVYAGQRDFVTYAVLLMLFGMISYFVIVFLVDMHTGIQESAVRSGKLRPEDVRPPCHPVLRAVGCSELPPGFLSPTADGTASPALAGERGGIEMAALPGASGAVDGSGIQASANPLFGLQGGAAGAGIDIGDADARRRVAGKSLDDAGPGDDDEEGDADDMLGSGRVGGDAHMTEMRRMTANILSMTHPPSSAAWPDIQQLFADMASQVDAHTKRAKMTSRAMEEAGSGADASGGATGHARAARKMLRGAGGSRQARKQFSQARLGSSRTLGAGTGVSMRSLAQGRRPSSGGGSDHAAE
ncbi:hypothetical protein FNF31_07409 [Cafeteria roenbergensis]|uniref:Cadherin domain-containing protein n=1 Tax=Cafeteria roenbergensis TaxID=33653 RepID=A0A5A8C718_CAFRO|nr:hypothetical protein FNF31_07409 [Cafeteria roenbergensis]